MREFELELRIEIAETALRMAERDLVDAEAGLRTAQKRAEAARIRLRDLRALRTGAPPAGEGRPRTESQGKN